MANIIPLLPINMNFPLNEEGWKIPKNNLVILFLDIHLMIISLFLYK